MNGRSDRRPLMAAGFLLGAGLGGFVDGILFHQVLQWHQMLTGKYPRTGVDSATAVVNMEINMFWDGLFHAFTWLLTVLGLGLLWRAGQRREVPWSTKTLLGALALGWGAFNVVEGTLDHLVLHVHHVREGPDHLPWDLGFLGFGVLLVLLGWVVARAGRNDPAREWMRG